VVQVQEAPILTSPTGGVDKCALRLIPELHGVDDMRGNARALPL
jgi:hypothetical protein